MAFFIDFKILKYSIVNTIETVEIKKDSSEPYEMIDFVKNLDIDNIGNQFVVDSYNKYLVEWTKIKNQTTESFDSIRRRKYVELLQNIQLNYLNQDEQRILGNIDWSNDLELEVAIPFFVEKIKDIIEYYINKRRDVKNSKVKWSTKGSKEYLENFISQYIIDNYTKNPNTFQKYKQDYQELSSFQSDFRIEYDGLYDLNDYRAIEFEITPSTFLSSSSDYDLSNLPITSFSDYNKDEKTVIDELKKELYKKYISVDYTFYQSVDNSIKDIKSTTPFYDPYNYQIPYISRISNTDNLLRDSDIGYYFTSKYLYTSNYFSPYGISISDEDELDGLFPKIDTYRSVDYRDYYSWSKYGETHQGLVGKPVTDKRLKRFYGYQSRDLNIDDSVGGVERYTDNIQLWSGDKNEKWSNDDIFDKFKGITLNRESKNDFFFTLKDNESLYKYACDIYGNQYYLIKEINVAGYSSNGGDQFFSSEYIYPVRSKTYIGGDIGSANFTLLGQRLNTLTGLHAIEIQENIVLGFSISAVNIDDVSLKSVFDYNVIYTDYYDLYSNIFGTNYDPEDINDTGKSLYENQYTLGKLYIRDVNSQQVKPIGEFLDQSEISLNISNKIIDIDIIEDFVVFTTESDISTGKINYDFSTGYLYFSELNKNVDSFFNKPKCKTSSYWHDSKNDVILYSNIDHQENIFNISYIETKTNVKVSFIVDNSNIDFDYENIISFQNMSKPQIIRENNYIYLVILLSDLCDNYYYQIIKYVIKSKNNICALYNRVYHPSKLKITENIRNEPVDSRKPELEIFYSNDTIYTNDIVYYWSEYNNTSETYNLPYAESTFEKHYDNDLKTHVQKSKAPKKYRLSSLTNNITPVQNLSENEDTYVFNGDYIYTPVDIELDFRNISGFEGYIPKGEPIYKIEYSLNGSIKTQYILQSDQISEDDEFYYSGITSLSALGSESESSQSLSAISERNHSDTPATNDLYKSVIGLSKPNEEPNIGIYNNTFQISPLNMKYITFQNDITDFSITFFSLSGKKYRFDFNFKPLNFSISEKYNKLELLDARLKHNNTNNNLDCILFLNARNPDSIIDTSVLNVDQSLEYIQSRISVIEEEEVVSDEDVIYLTDDNDNKIIANGDEIIVDIYGNIL